MEQEKQIYSFKVSRCDGLRGSGRIMAVDHRDARNQVFEKYGVIGVNATITLLKNQSLAMKQWNQH